jgi:hypothetical protein
VTEQPQPPEANYPEVADDDDPERLRYPEIREPGLPADDGYVGADKFGTTPAEEREGESLTDRLAAEVPDTSADPLAAAEPQDERGIVAASEAADEGVGRLVEPDEGGSADTEKDAIASRAGMVQDPTAEEDAVRLRDPS